jgi:uncharacterized membrane protein YgcG
VIAAAAEAAATMLQRAFKTQCLLVPEAATAVTLGSYTSAAEQPEPQETAACIAAYKLLSQLTLELSDMLEKTFQRQQASDTRTYELLKSLPASATQLLRSTEAMLQLCSWMLAVESSQLMQLLCHDSDQLSGASRATAADSVAGNDALPKRDTVFSQSSTASAQRADSMPGMTSSAGSHSSHPASVSSCPVPSSSLQHAEGLLLHNADVLTALLNSTAPTPGGPPAEALSALHGHDDVVASTAGSASAGPTPDQHEHTQRLVSAVLHSLKQAVQQQQAALAVPASFVTAAGAASAAGVTCTEQDVPGDLRHSSPACVQLLAAVSRLLKGLVQMCLHQHDSFLSQGMTHWLFTSSSRKSAAAASVGQEGGATVGTSDGSNAGSSGGGSAVNSPSSSADHIAAPDLSSSKGARPHHNNVNTDVKLPGPLTNLLELLVCTAGAALTMISTGKGTTVPASEVLQLSGSLIEAAELLLELPVTLQCKAARIIMQLAGDKAAIADSFDKLWARTSQLPGTCKHAQQQLLSVGASAQQAPMGMQLLGHAVRTTLLLLSVAKTPASASPSSSQSSAMIVLGQVCAMHRWQCSDVLKMAMEQRRGGGSLLAMLLDSQLRLAMKTGSQQQNLQQLAFAVQVLEAASRTTLHHVWPAKPVDTPSGAQQPSTSTAAAAGGSSSSSSSIGGGSIGSSSSSGRGGSSSSKGGSSSRGRRGTRGSASNRTPAAPQPPLQQDESAAREGFSLFLSIEHSVMRPVAFTAAEVFATAAVTAAAAAATCNTGSSSALAAGAVNTIASLFSSIDGQMLLQALLSFSLTVGKACAGPAQADCLMGWQWTNWPEKPGVETSPLLLANMALLGVQSQLSEQLHCAAALATCEDSSAALVSLQEASSSGSSGSSGGVDGGDGSSRAMGSSNRAACSNSSSVGGCGASITASAITDSGSTSINSSCFSSSSSGPSGSGQPFSAAPWQQLLCAAAALTSKMLHLEASSVTQARPLAPEQAALNSSAVTLPVDWLCGNIFRVQSGNKALDLLQQHASQLGLQGWQAPTAGAAPVSSGPGSLLQQVQLTCTLLQRWCDWISKHSSLESSQAGHDSMPGVPVGSAAYSAASSASTGQAAAQVVSQQQQQQQLVKGLQDAVSILSLQLLPVLSKLYKLTGRYVQKHGCDLSSDDPVNTSKLTNACRWLVSTESGRHGPSEEDRRTCKAIVTALSGVAAALKAASSTLAAAVPCSYTCNNWGCRNLSTVSEGFALVRGKGCVCGGCLGVGRDCSIAPAGSQSLLAAR